VPRLLQEAGRPRDTAPLMVVRFGRFVYAPVVVVYLAILYAYGLKVLFTQELPKNLVSPLVLAAGLLGMAGALLMEPLHADREQRGLSLLVRWVPALLLPLLPFAYLAILMRQGQYGWTEFRYLRLAGTILLTIIAILGTVWLARRRMPPLASVPGILALGLLLVSIGPWSAQAVSRRDQQRRLRAALSTAGARLPMRLGTVRDSITVTAEQHDAIRDGVIYLAETHGTDAVADVVGPDARTYSDGSQIADALALRTRCAASKTWGLEAILPPGTPIPLPAGQVVQLGSAMRAQPTSTSIRTELAGTTVKVWYSGSSSQVDLRSLVASLGAQPQSNCRGNDHYRWGMPLSTAQIRHPLRQGATQRGELLLTSLRVNTDSTGVSSITNVEGFLWLPR
jgi:hypothetical protein